MDKLVKKVTYDLPNLPGQDVYMYDAADAETNRMMSWFVPIMSISIAFSRMREKKSENM